VIEYPVPAAEQVCTGCDAPLVPLGIDVTEELDFVPASLQVIAHHRPKYACRHCGDHVVQQPLPARLIERGRPGPGLLAHVVISKVGDHLPLHRQSGILARHGVAIARSTLADWMAAVAEAVRPLYAHLKAEVLASAIIQTDDTPVPVLDRTRDRTKTGRLWPYCGDAAHPAIVFDYTPTRARDGPVAFLGDWAGYLQADAYPGYDVLFATGRMVEVGCWAHARRKIFEARTSDRVHAHQGIAFIRRLYDVERATAAATPAERHAARQAQSVPILAEIRAWLDGAQDRVLPRSPMGEALTYLHNQWTALTRYCDDGRLQIDNNRAERAVRPIAIGRKNWTFAGSDRGAEHLAILASLVATCRENAIEPFAYLRDVLAKLPTHPTTRLAELTPRGWQAALAAESAAAADAAASS
jgi:transposase